MPLRNAVLNRNMEYSLEIVYEQASYDKAAAAAKDETAILDGILSRGRVEDGFILKGLAEFLGMKQSDLLIDGLSAANEAQRKILVVFQVPIVDEARKAAIDGKIGASPAEWLKAFASGDEPTIESVTIGPESQRDAGPMG